MRNQSEDNNFKENTATGNSHVEDSMNYDVNVSGSVKSASDNVGATTVPFRHPALPPLPASTVNPTPATTDGAPVGDGAGSDSFIVQRAQNSPNGEVLYEDNNNIVVKEKNPIWKIVGFFLIGMAGIVAVLFVIGMIMGFAGYNPPTTDWSVVKEQITNISGDGKGAPVDELQKVK